MLLSNYSERLSMIFCCSDSVFTAIDLSLAIYIYTTGSTNREKIAPITSPLEITTPIQFLLIAPAPEDVTNG